MRAVHWCGRGIVGVLGVCLLVGGLGCKGSGEPAATPSSADAAMSTAPAGPKFDAELYAAAEHGNRSGVGYRLDEGADINAPNPKNGWTALHAAAYNGHKKLVAYLLTRGANPNVQDNEGNTALHLAASLGHGDTTAALVTPTDQTIRNKTGKTPREVAAPKVLVYFPKA